MAQNKMGWKGLSGSEKWFKVGWDGKV